MEAGLGSLGSAVLYYGFAFLMVVWMCIKIARGSVILALLTFFFWPLALISLIRNWGESDTDIRIPFFAAVAALGMSFFMVGRGADQFLVEAAPYFSEAELRVIARENPAAYDTIMQARADFVAAGGDLDALAYEDDEDYADSDWQATVSPPARRPARSSTAARSGDGLLPEPATPPVALDPLVDLAQTAAGLSYLYSRVEWPQAQAHIQLPSRFRFVPANRLHRMARLRSQPMPAGALGWITHETVDLGQPESWVMEVRHIGSGRLVEGESGDERTDFSRALAQLAGAPVLDGSSRSLGSGKFAPQWDTHRHLLTWSLESPEGESDHHTVLPLRQGALQFSVRGLQPDQREFGQRATRLLAASVEVTAGERWQDPARTSDTKADASLLQWVQGHEPTPLPKPVP